jgi:hypothetical protein
MEVLNGLISTRLHWYLGVIKGLRLSTKVEMLFVNNEILNCNQIDMLLASYQIQLKPGTFTLFSQTYHTTISTFKLQSKHKLVGSPWVSMKILHF